MLLWMAAKALKEEASSRYALIYKPISRYQSLNHLNQGYILVSVVIIVSVMAY